MANSILIFSFRADEVVARVNFIPPSMEYTLDIAPGADMALIIAFCVAMDCKAKSEKELDYLLKGVQAVSTVVGLMGDDSPAGIGGLRSLHLRVTGISGQ